MEIKLDLIKGIGPKLYQSFKNDKIWSTYDLVLRHPRGYEHFVIRSIDEVKHGDTVTMIAKVVSEVKFVQTKRVTIISCDILINTVKLKLVAFNRPYLINQLKIEEHYLIKGKYDLYKRQLTAQVINQKHQVDYIKPLYKISGVYDSKISALILEIFTQKQVNIYETLLPLHLEKYHLPKRLEAYQMLHLPKDSNDIHQAQRRFKYEEAFFLHLKLFDSYLKKKTREPKVYDLNQVKKLIETIPYELTSDQKTAVNDIFKDFKKEETSYRLVLGDVGSGKTVVAALAIYAVITAHQQVAFMAPTELLAQQHYLYFKSFFEDIKVGLLTSSTVDKDLFKEKILNQEYDLVIGTHALITKDVIFKNLGLVVIDEQHKFGVEARQLLIDKAKEQDVLYLSATPIPRTLALLLFNQADISKIIEKPQQRKAIKTTYITPKEKNKVYQLIEKAITKLEHTYIVVPAISSTKVTHNIETVYEELRSEFNVPIFVLHGKIKQDEREQIMINFKQTPGSILLATTMIEVGIDIPTATLMVIYDAEHFGLSQLHQLRGRVGRSHLQSHCVLISNKEDIERLKLLTETQDGFELSNFDLIDRGPGDFLGVEQSGYLKFNFLNLATDETILKIAYDDVNELVKTQDFQSNPKYKHLRQYMGTTIKM